MSNWCHMRMKRCILWRGKTEAACSDTSQGKTSRTHRGMPDNLD